MNSRSECGFCRQSGRHTDLCPVAFRDALPVVCADCGVTVADPLVSLDHGCPVEATHA